jgi:transposase
MKMFVDPSEVSLHRDFVDFRKAINGLAALVEDELNRDAYTGLYSFSAIKRKIN